MARAGPHRHGAGRSIAGVDARPPLPAPATGTPAPEGPRRPQLLGLLGLLVLLGVALTLRLLAPALGLEGLLPWSREVPAQDGGASLAAPAAPSTGPRLSSAGAAAPEAVHGPVLVEVLGLDGQPLAGVRVRAVPAPPAAGTPPAADGSAAAPWTSDAQGLVRIADLPYDGRTQVQALLRPEPAGEVTEIPFAVEAGQDSLVFSTTLAGNGGSVAFTPRITVAPVVTPGEEPAPAPVPAPEPAPEPSERSTLDTQGAMQAADLQQVMRALRAALQAPSSVAATAPVRGPTVRLVVDAGLPLDVRIEEAGDGRARPDARWRVSPRLAWADASFGAPTLPVMPGTEADVGLRVEAPEGWVARQQARYTPFIHPAARRLQVTYPVRPAVDLALVVPEEGQPLRPEDWSGSITVAGQPVADGTEVRVDARGRLRLRGGAFLRGDLVEVQGRLGTRFAARGTALLGSDPRATVEVTLVLEPLPPVTDTVELEEELSFGFAGASIELSLGGVRPGGARTGEAAARGPLPLRVLDGRGAPAAGARVRMLGQAGEATAADASGRVVLPDVASGAVRLVVLGAGAPCVLEVEAGALPRNEQVLATPAGGTLAVTVQDETGAGLPYATLELALPEDLPWIDLEDGVQRLDPLVDARGQRTLRAVPPGKVVLRAHFGTRSAQAEVQLRDGQAEAVTLVLPGRTLDGPGSAPPPAR